MNEQRQQREAGLVRCLWESAWASMQTVRELQDRLVASRARQMFDMEVQVQGEIISDRGVRFLEEVGERLM